MAIERRPHELGGENVPERVGRKIADQAGAPVDVLEHALGVVGRADAEVRFEAVVPCGREVAHVELPLHDRPLEIEAEHDVEVVRDLVGLDADARGSHAEQRFVHRVGVGVGERRGKSGTRARKAPCPEVSRAADEVLPEPRLRLVHAERRRLAGRQPIPVATQSLLVQAVPRLVHDPEQGRGQEAFVPPGGDPAVIGTGGRTERMIRRVEPSALEVETDARRDLLHEAALDLDRIVPTKQRVVGTLPRLDAASHERHDARAQPAEDLGDRRPAGAGLVIVHQRVVGIEVGKLARRLLALEAEDASQPRLQHRPRGIGPSPGPCLLPLDTGAGQLLDQPGGEPRLLGEIVTEQANRRLRLGRSVPGQRACGEGGEPLPLHRIDALAVDERGQRRHLIRAIASRGDGHHRAFIPAEQPLDRREQRGPAGVVARGGEGFLGGGDGCGHGCLPAGCADGGEYADWGTTAAMDRGAFAGNLTWSMCSSSPRIRTTPSSAWAARSG